MRLEIRPYGTEVVKSFFLDIFKYIEIGQICSHAKYLNLNPLSLEYWAVFVVKMSCSFSLLDVRNISGTEDVRQKVPRLA